MARAHIQSTGMLHSQCSLARAAEQIRKQRGRYQSWIDGKSIVLYGAPMLATHMAPSHSVPYVCAVRWHRPGPRVDGCPEALSQKQYAPQASKRQSAPTLFNSLSSFISM